MLDEITKENKVDYAVVYGEFMYQAGPWPYERRVVCKVEKPENQMVYMLSLIHILVACNTKEMYRIEKAVKAQDEEAFMIVMNSNEVHGEGFRVIG